MATLKSQKMPLVLLPIVFFIAVPVLFIKENIQDIARLEVPLFQNLIGLALIAIVLLLGVNAVLRKVRMDHWLVNSVEVLCFFIVAAGFVFPVSISTGMVDPGEVPANLTNIVFVLISAGVMVWLATGEHRQTFYIWLTLFIILNTAFSAYVLVTEFRNQGNMQGFYEISSKRNIFVLSLDGIPNSAAREVLDENQELAENFDGFTIFSHAVSSSPATDASNAVSMYGNKNFKLGYRTSKQIWGSSPDELLTNYLNGKGYKVSTFGNYSTKFKEKERQFRSTVAHGLSTLELINFTITRTLTGWFVIPRGLPGWLEQQIRGDIGLAQDEENILIERVASIQPQWKKRLVVTVLDLERYIRKLENSVSEPVAHFSHYSFTHFPVHFDRDCQYMGDDAQWVEKRQNRFGVKEETYCVLVKFSEFIGKLKELDVFDQSMIVLKSDHGKPVSYYEPGTFLSETINGHSHWGYGRYEPFMAIKEFGPVETGLKFNATPVLLDDMARTICVAALESSQCQLYPGFNILDKALVIPDDATVTLFIVKDEKSTFKFRTHKAVTVKRQPDILQNLHNSLTIESE